MLVPEVVRSKALDAGAQAWLDELPGLVAGLERDWGITVGRPFPGATEAFVAEVSGPGPGAVAVLKLVIPRPGDHARNEITVLRLAGGDGCARRAAAHDDERAVLVHGDVHQWNVLEAPRGFKLVDPDGLLAEAECDLGVLMREDPVELRHGDPWARARWLARRCGLDATAIWEWGTAERVSTGLLCTAIGLQPVGREMLVTADCVSRYETLAPARSSRSSRSSR